MLLLLHYVRVIKLFHPNQGTQFKEMKSRFAPVLLCLVLIPVNQHLFNMGEKRKKTTLNTTLIIRMQLSGSYNKQTALCNKEIKMNLGVDGLCSRTIYRDILSESLFEEGTIKFADLFVLVSLVTNMARATGIRLPFYSRCDSSKVKPLSFKR